MLVLSVTHLHQFRFGYGAIALRGLRGNAYNQPEKTAFLGYEFVATDMQSSSSYEDLCDE